MKKMVLLCCLLSLISCKEELEKPKKFIEKDKMTDVLYDMALLNGMESMGVFYADTTASIITASSILKKYKIDSLTFVENNRYYIELEDESYFQIQEEIKKRLEVKKEKLKKEVEAEQEKAKLKEEDEKVKAVKTNVKLNKLSKVAVENQPQE
ncbi:DUF4296 domain-containing protein [Flavobacterium sp. HSC-61S13]|uniref:DUF4296 domain-containing protein n=1 Tax=Flavobacterium sp. HSC-61S13 TaxID=2910963 RepID=UPI00209DD4E1|nr:DUF4296 domain-containing protein [Flavobacterium sp. HSC-61S13]MCP1995322.1 hypothetical protein [Flavobacterium sp. HSC-61S13]